MLKFVTYFLTIAFAMFFAFWELRLKHQLTDRASSPSRSPSELGVMNERMNRERLIESLPKKARARLRTVVVLKFLFVAILIVEVIVLQRPK
jgi:hypothetical protein